MSIMTLRRLQQAGHKPIVLMGGGTTKVGDPTGKDKTRPTLTDEGIAANMASIKRAFEKFLVFGDGPTDAIMVNNDDWLSGLNYLEFLRDYGRHFSINRMLTMDSVKLRLEREQPLTFLEFNYMILQAYDFVKLKELYNCRLQIGGSDQWGNISSGTSLFGHISASESHLQIPFEIIDTPESFEKKNSDKATFFEASYIQSQLPPGTSLIGGIQWNHTPGLFKATGTRCDDIFGLTTPLITTASGTKMGKTESGAVWLNEDMLSSYDYWQFWRNTDDRDVGKFLHYFTDLPLEEIERLEALEGAELNEAKKQLADAATALCRGPAAAEAAYATAQAAFGGAAGNLPEVALPAAELAQGLRAFELFFKAGLATSGGEARRLIRGGGAKVDDVTVTDENAVMVLAPGVTGLKLSAGKKQHKRVVPQA